MYNVGGTCSDHLVHCFRPKRAFALGLPSLSFFDFQISFSLIITVYNVVDLGSSKWGSLSCARSRSEERTRAFHQG